MFIKSTNQKGIATLLLVIALTFLGAGLIILSAKTDNQKVRNENKQEETTISSKAELSISIDELDNDDFQDIEKEIKYFDSLSSGL